jgi:hypothetical protein
MGSGPSTPEWANDLSGELVFLRDGLYAMNKAKKVKSLGHREESQVFEV